MLVIVVIIRGLGGKGSGPRPKAAGKCSHYFESPGNL